MQPFLEFLIRSTLLLFIGGCVVGLLFRFSSCKSPDWNRFAWAFVLFLGIAAIRVTLEIPALTPQPVSQAIPAPQTPSLILSETFEASRTIFRYTAANMAGIFAGICNSSHFYRLVGWGGHIFCFATVFLVPDSPAGERRRDSAGDISVGMETTACLLRHFKPEH